MRSYYFLMMVVTAVVCFAGGYGVARLRFQADPSAKVRAPASMSPSVELPGLHQVAMEQDNAVQSQEERMTVPSEPGARSDPAVTETFSHTSWGSSAHQEASSEGGTNRPWEGYPMDWTNRMVEMASRAAEMRSHFVETARLDENQVARFDVLVESMNMRIRSTVDDWKSFASDNPDLSRDEVRARFLSELTSIFVLTYDEFDRSLPAGWRDAAGDDFNLRALMAPSIWEEIRPLMGRRGWQQGGRTNAWQRPSVMPTSSPPAQ